jgi:transcriptional regulator
VAESGGLLNRCSSKGYHRFESCRLRQFDLYSPGYQITRFDSYFLFAVVAPPTRRQFGGRPALRAEASRLRYSQRVAGGTVVGMYTPKFFAETDTQKLLAFMREYNFAVLVTVENDRPEGTHLPFIIEESDGKLILLAHMAKANPQWKQFSDKNVLVIFSEPHAYVSPLLYKEKQNVPTWNYVAVHAYGKVKVFEPEQNLALLEKQIEAFDPSYFKGNWRDISDDYKTNLAKGIVAFEIEVADLQGKKKLNQNKPGEEAHRVIEAFETGSAGEQEIARYMRDVHGEE